MKIKKNNMSPAERVELENLRATAAKNEADIAYIAMMSDIDLDTEEEGADYE